MDANTGVIARLWRGATRAADADAYLEYLHKTGFAEYRATPGNRGVLALRRLVDGKAEWWLLTLWESEEAIRRFAGPDLSHAVFYPEDERFLVAADAQADHFAVVFQEVTEG